MVSGLGILSVPLPLSPNFFPLLYFVGSDDNIRAVSMAMNFWIT